MPSSLDIRVTGFASHDAAGPSEVLSPGYCLIRPAGAAWSVMPQLKVVGTLRNLLNDSYYSSYGTALGVRARPSRLCCRSSWGFLTASERTPSKIERACLQFQEFNLTAWHLAAN